MRTKSGTLGCLVLAAVFLAASCTGIEPVQTETFVMNTFLIQTVYGSEEAASSDEALVRALEEKLSRTLPESEISKLVEADGAEVALSEDTLAVLGAALHAQEETGGAYNPFLGELRDLWGFGREEPAVPDAQALEAALNQAQSAQLTLTGSSGAAAGANIDLGGIAKGYALDLMRDNLASQGVSSALINFGGALLAMGSKPDGPWLIGVRDPLTAQGGSIAEFEAADVCIETSGISEQSFEQDGRQYHHLLDPQTGWPADNDLASVTVTSASGTEADVMATALFVMGLREGLQFADDHGISALFVTRERSIYLSAAFPFELTVTDNSFSHHEE